MIDQVTTVARHELLVLAKTKRALIFAAMYLGGALLSAFLYVMAIKAIEEQALSLLVQNGAHADAASGAITVAGQKAFEQMLAFFAGADISMVAESLKSSVVLPALLWGSLAFLPFLIVLTGFDVLASDLGARTLCYSTLRAPRKAVLLGKLAAQVVLYVALTIVASLSLVLLAALKLDSFSLTSELQGLLRVWLLLIPYGLCYLGIATFASASARQPALALFMALALMVGLGVAGWFAAVPESSSYAILRELRWLSPSHYQAGFWQSGVMAPLASAGAYVGFAMIFVLLALKRLEARDL